MKKYLSAIVIAGLLTTTLFATQINKKIEVAMNTVKIMVNGEKVEADNIVYEGTTYVPLRAVSELLGKEVNWVEESKTAHINDQTIQQENPIALITMEDGGQIKLELYPEIAPTTVKNFVKLVEEGFYEGLIFHRVIPGFMVQGGDPNGNGTGGSDQTIQGEFVSNGIKNDLLHTRGVLSMARSQNPNSASSQFFIMVEDAPSLDGSYAGFGKVLEGMDVVDKIVNTPTDGNDKPTEPQVIKRITIVK